MAPGARERVGAILLLGTLSMFFAEGLSGSSVLWFLAPLSWVLAFPLYTAHALLFVNLALRFRRTALPSLYLWGVLFGLYEAWITKVAWAGYLGAAPGWGRVLGFAMPETLIIVLCWHALFAWILPLLAFEVLGGPGAVLPHHRRLLARTRGRLALGGLLAAVGALFLAWSALGNLVAVLGTIAGSALLIALSHRLASPRGRAPSIESLRLDRRGMGVLAGYLVVLYAGSFVLIAPDRIAPPLTIGLTLVLYAVVVLLLRAAGPDAPAAEASAAEVSAAPTVTRRDLGAGLALLAALGLASALAMPAASPLVIAAYLALVVAGPVMLVAAVVAIARGRRRAGGPATSSPVAIRP